MPGFLSWLSRMFTGDGPSPRTNESRLMNLTACEEASNPKQDERLEQLEQHLFCWLLDTDPRGLAQEDERDRILLDELARRLREGRIQELPRQPLTLPMLMRALSDENSDRRSLTRIILDDPAVTDQTLQMANSPMFRPGDHSIESVDNAVFVLGIDGIRSVVSASVMRPMLAARNSREALFARRVWLWGLSCARSAEQIARIHGQDASAWFLVGLLPALAYMTLFRELQRIVQVRNLGAPPAASVLRLALSRHQWGMSQLLANEWNLPPRYHACLFEAERPSPGDAHSPLNDGIVVGTREVLLHARQRNMAEEQLLDLVQLSADQLGQVRHATQRLLRE